MRVHVGPSNSWLGSKEGANVVAVMGESHARVYRRCFLGPAVAPTWSHALFRPFVESVLCGVLPIVN